MEVLNISGLGNQIKSFFVIGKNNEGDLILCAPGERTNYFKSSSYDVKMILYKYDPVANELKPGMFDDLNIFYDYFELRMNNEIIYNGKGCFLEASDTEELYITECDFNNNTYERLFTISSVGDIGIYESRIQLIPLTDNYLAVKTYNKASCLIWIYDKERQRKYDILFPEDDDMRYSGIHYISINNEPYIVFIKNGKSDWKMEYFIHKWEWTDEFKRYKDEKIFLFPLQELIDNGSMFLSEHNKIAQAGETHYLEYRGNIKNCVAYSFDDLRKYDGQEVFEDRLYFYDAGKKNIAKDVTYHGSILISDKGNIYERRRDKEQLVLADLDENKVYRLPYKNGWPAGIIDDYVVLNFRKGIIIYDFKNERESGKYLAEDKKLYVSPPQVRDIAIKIDFKYFADEDLLVLY